MISFSEITKNELARVIDSRQCCWLAELAALVKMNGSIQISDQQFSLSIITGNAAVARKMIVLFKNSFKIQAKVMVRRKVRLKKNNIYLVRLPAQYPVEKTLNTLGMWDFETRLLNTKVKAALLAKECCRRAYLRGLFLASGSVNNPVATYHLEITTESVEYAAEIEQLMKKMGLSAKTSIRPKRYVVYLKESDQIVKCLNITGAHTALLNFENRRIYKGVRNQVNRLVNFETANLNKTVNAAVRQLNNINYIADTIGLNQLPPAIKELAELRLEHPEIGLKELGALMNPSLGKSGVNHRMRKLEQIAGDLVK